MKESALGTHSGTEGNGTGSRPAANLLEFTHSDTVSGYVTSLDWDNDRFRMATSDGRPFEVTLTDVTAAEVLRNTTEPYSDCTGVMRELLTEGRFVTCYGIFYPGPTGTLFEAKHIIFYGRDEDEYRFEDPQWWVRQLTDVAHFYLRAEFGNDQIDFAAYRTVLTRQGFKTSERRQETDTISRLVYGLATAYMMTGEDRFLEAAQAGTLYLREHMRFVDPVEDICYWYHGIDVAGDGHHERKIFSSEFGDDIDAIPMYEQIYALSGPMQTYRITGDPAIMRDVEMTLRLFEKHYHDPTGGGYFSHLDPVTLDPRSETLGHNRARKNWNSVGDHAPAYLINLWLVTKAERFADFLEYTADTITARFPDFENSPFVQERFHEDWSHDKQWGWQQDRAVVGHNLKIAWNLMRINALRPKPEYVELARRIADVMPDVGCDRQRGGWYDVMERSLRPGRSTHGFVWHDRKAWWQQEQAILAYLILAGELKDERYLKLARESSAFHNAFFLDSDEGGIFFNVFANGMPYQAGTERLKGSHSMGGYHSTELCYLAATYTNLLITRQPLDLYFKPQPQSFPDRLLHVQPDILPPGSVVIGEVWVDGKVHQDFDSAALAVRLPESERPLLVKVRLLPVEPATRASIESSVADGVARLTLRGDIVDEGVEAFRDQMITAVALQPHRVVLNMDAVTSFSATAVRAVIFARQKIGADVEIYVIGAAPAIKKEFELADFAEDVIFADRLPG